MTPSIPSPPSSCMDFIELGDMGSGCEDENCGLSSGSLEDCPNQECQWEEPDFGLVELVCVTVIYIPLMLLGLLGNILTILVVWLRPHMRSSTYLYLSSMAVSDLLILLLLPLDLYKLWRPRPWPFGDLACKLTMFMSECCTFCTILHITFLSIERYLAVCWPITAKTLVTRRRTRALIGCLWLGAAISAAPVLVMVGVEEVRAEEPVLGGWREDRGWTGREGEQGRFVTNGRERGSGELLSMEGGVEGRKWGESIGELKWVGETGERNVRTGLKEERKQGDEGKTRDEGGGKEEEVEGKQQNNLGKEDKGGGEESVDGGWGFPDTRECRCTDYAVSSGLLSAMMILSNLYFLVPFCILGLVYSLIGRTLWLRPESSRRDQSHRHTVKMLGVIVLAFVLCWLPFHVGRTIFSLSQATSTEGEEAYNFSKAHSEISNPSESTDTHWADAVNEMHTNTVVQHEDVSRDLHLNAHVITHAGQKHRNTSMGIHHLDPSIKTGTHTTAQNKTHSNTTLVDRQLGTFADNSDINENIYNSTSTDNDTQRIIPSHASFPTSTQHHRSSSLDEHTLTNSSYRMQICMGSHTPPTSGTSSPYPVTPTHPYSNTPFNITYTHPDTYYFLYYLSQYFNLVSSVLFYLSAAVNPLLYNLMSARYRHAVHSLIHAHSHTQSHRRRTLTGQHSTTTL
ncbi:uncharacterized protein LOC117832955 [Notolabrus celidotus]|uniref:uncharacterized protein LOC117832955 n=1 Tax=Notolabrus celidotus TaxID=1203425 RepID=UPI001490357A|nr:uncharacterized protein LOC117832955 [Notolabrus celidotus]